MSSSALRLQQELYLLHQMLICTHHPPAQPNEEKRKKRELTQVEDESRRSHYCVSSRGQHQRKGCISVANHAQGRGNVEGGGGASALASFAADL